MQIQDDIVLTVLRAKDIAGCMGENFIDREKHGEKIDKCCEMKLMLLIRWIKILENYYCENFNDAGAIEEPNLPCLTESEALDLLSKVKALIKTN